MDTMTSSSSAPGAAPHDLDDDLNVTDIAGRLRLGATRLARLLRQQADSGLTPTQLATLATIARSGPLPIGTLAEVEQVSPPTATKVVDKLEDAGYVRRERHADDRRVALVAITAGGQDVLTDIRARRTAWLATRVAELSPTDVAALADALDVIERLTAAPQPSDTPQEPS